jgi:hypothetical protein
VNVREYTTALERWSLIYLSLKFKFELAIASRRRSKWRVAGPGFVEHLEPSGMDRCWAEFWFFPRLLRVRRCANLDFCAVYAES